MKTTQGWGWLAAGVLALGLNGFYQDGGLVRAHQIVDAAMGRVADRSMVLADLGSEQVERVLERANLVAARDEVASCRLATAVARFQGKIARTQSGIDMEGMSARQEAALVRVEAERARIEARVVRARMVPVAFNTLEIPAVACSRVRVNVPRVNVPRVRVPRVPMIPAPVVRVETGGGPI